MLNVDVFGDGPDLVMLHGWGMHSGVMTSWAQAFAERFRVNLVDLPGHGKSGDGQLAGLEDWADAVLATVPATAWWLGWSLGGLVALAASRRKPEHVRGVVLIASTPKFVAGPDWQTAIDADVFDQFSHQLQGNIERTLQRFLSLQVRGSDRSGEMLRQLRAQLKTRPQADPQALRAGLAFLKHCDMRQALERQSMPVFAVLGERDTLVPKSVSSVFSAGHSAVIPGAGHAPFLSHPQLCMDQVQRWLLLTEQVDCAAV